MAIALAEVTLIDAREFLWRCIECVAGHFLSAGVDVPAFKAAGHTVWAVWAVGKHAFVSAAVNGYSAIGVLKTIGDVKHVTGVDITPDNV
jgi:hypothetical protein